MWFSLTFPWLFQSVQNFLTFPWLENAFPFFQVFQVFQSEWEPWIWVRKDHQNIHQAFLLRRLHLFHDSADHIRIPGFISSIDLIRSCRLIRLACHLWTILLTIQRAPDTALKSVIKLWLVKVINKCLFSPQMIKKLFWCALNCADHKFNHSKSKTLHTMVLLQRIWHSEMVFNRLSYD